jgi:ParB-like partition proteins
MKRLARLGRGLDAILSVDANVEVQRLIPIDEISPNPNQPRRRFSEEELKELAESISKFGILHPIIVREKDGKYEIVAGERRWRAAKMAGLTRIPAVVKEVSDEEMMIISLVENLQREDLNPVERARAIKILKEEMGLTDEEISKYLGKSRSAVTNTLRILNLPLEVLDMLAEGRISEGHARVLLRLKDKEEILSWARRIVEENLSVRDLENLINPSQAKKNTEFLKTLVLRFKEKGLNAKVKRSKKHVSVEIKFSSEEEAERFLEFLPDLKNAR